jgi:hypothetical protein
MRKIKHIENEININEYGNIRKVESPKEVINIIVKENYEEKKVSKTNMNKY